MSNHGILITQPQYIPETSLGDNNKEHTAAHFFLSHHGHDWARRQGVSLEMSKQNFSEWATAAAFADDNEDQQIHHHHHSSDEYGMNADELDTDAMQAASDVLNLMDFDQSHHQLHHEKRPLQGNLTDGPSAKRLRLESMLLPMDPSNMTGTLMPPPTAATGKPPAASTKKVHNEQWDAMFDRLRAYKEKYGNCLVPKRFVDDPKLGTWVETQVRVFVVLEFLY